MLEVAGILSSSIIASTILLVLALLGGEELPYFVLGKSNYSFNHADNLHAGLRGKDFAEVVRLRNFYPAQTANNLLTMIAHSFLPDAKSQVQALEISASYHRPIDLKKPWKIVSILTELTDVTIV